MRHPIFAIVTAVLMTTGGAQSPPRRVVLTALAGTYNGGQPEVAAALDLGGDGRFRYALSYGALDETAAGRWTVEGDRVLLTSDPVVPPRFVLLGRNHATTGRLTVRLALPDGLSRQFFHVEARLADGTTVDRQLAEEDGPVDLPPGARAVTVTLTLPMFDLRSAAIALDDDAFYDVWLRFEPNDLGKAAFARTPLPVRGGDFLLTRHDLIIRFRRTGKKFKIG